MSTVSVIMPTYNDEPHIALSIASVLLQDYAYVELVIVNDASTDGTSQIVEAFAARDERIVLLHNDRNLGRPLARNRAIETARGDLIAILDADDIAMPHRISCQVAYLRDHPEVGILGSWAIAIDVNNQPLEPLERPTVDADIRRQLAQLNMPFIHSTVMFRRRVLMSTGLYDARFKASQDVHLCYRVVQEVQAASLPQFLALYRIRSSADSALIRERFRWAARVGREIFKQQPSIVGAQNLIRLYLLSLLPGPVIRKFSSIHKDRWDQTLLSQEQIAGAQHWLERLREQV